MNILVFDIQTIPDIDGARRLYDLHGLSDEDVAKAIFHKRRQQAHTEFLPHHLHQIVAISAVLVNDENFKVWSLGDENSSEMDLLQRFYAGIERYTPSLISWNGSAFDMPVIHYRSLLYPVNAGRYWDSADISELADNNYATNHHRRHIDLMDVLSGFQAKATIGLDEIATLCGFPGNMVKHDNNVWETWLTGNTGSIRNEGEINVLNIYLIYLNWQRNRAVIDQLAYLQQCQRVREQLKFSNKVHFIEFEKSWIDL